MWKQMREDDFDQMAIKIVIVGNGVVGKSSMIQRYCNGHFTNEYKKTIGVDFLERLLQINSTEIRLMLWDTAGQEEFDALTKAYYRGAQGCVVAFSTTDKQSFDAIEKWKKKVEFECGDIPMALVQNKADLLEQRAMSSDEVDRLARRLQMRLFLTSAKNNVNVDEVFHFLAKSYLDSLDEDTYEEPMTMKKQESLSYSLLPSNPLFQSPKKYTKKNKNKKALKLQQQQQQQQQQPFPLSSALMSARDYQSHHLGGSGPSSAMAAGHGTGVGNGGGGGGSSMSAPLLQHFRYERRYQLIPGQGGRTNPSSNPATILLHHPWQPYYAGGTLSQRSHQLRQQHQLRKSRARSKCWIL